MILSGVTQTEDMEKEKGIGRYIPYIMAIGALLASYKLLGVSRWMGDLETRELEETYDYIIGNMCVLCCLSIRMLKNI